MTHRRIKTFVVPALFVCICGSPPGVVADSPWIVPAQGHHPSVIGDMGGTSLSPGAAGHRVIQPPALRPQRYGSGHDPFGSPLAGAPEGRPSHHAGPWSKAIQRKMKAQLQVPPPAIPGARQRPVWKAPYSYGYFGASGKKHWSQHYGYRDRYTQWTLR